LNRFRFWISLAYVASTVWAGSVHHHDGHGAENHIRPVAGCGDDCAHFVDHEVLEPGQTPADCPACQLRSQPFVMTWPRLEIVEASSVRLAWFEALPAREFGSSRPSTRAPPRS
jgi:hypothetical protein